MSSTDPVNPNNRFSRYTGRPPQSPMGPRLRAQRSTPSSPEHNPRHSTSTHLTLNLLDPPSLIIERSTLTPPPEIPPQTTKVAPKRPMLTPPPTLDFDTVPVQWKGLPLEAALWTFDSRELQRLVSRAIRLTARESFIRLLSLENLERVLPTEIERLRGLKLSTQSRYRFLVHRRTMLLQALNSSADSATNSSSPNNSSNTKNNNVVSQLAVQLAQTTAECDRVLEELLRIDDQLAQIERMMDMHWTSALAIALRKLNKSYAQRSSELLEARNRIEQLEAELDDAWNEAERIAKEMDNYTMNDFDVEEAVILKAERISGTNSPTFGALLQVKPLPVFTPLSPMAVPQFLQTPNEEDNNVDYPPPTQQPQTQPRSQHQHQHQHQNPTKDTVDTSSIRSGKSTRSTKSMRSAKSAKNPDTFHLSLVTAARKRSHRTSKGSLRLPRTPTRSRSHSRTGTTHSHDQSQAHNEEEHPPVPDIPIEFSLDSSLPSASPKPSSNIVWPGSSTHSQISFGTQFHSHSRTHSRMVSTSSRRYRRTSADDIISLRTTQMREMEKGRRDSSSSYAPTVTLDDINVPPPSYDGHDEIQVVPRTPTLIPTFTLPPAPVHRFPRGRLSKSVADPRKRLSQSVDAALNAVATPLSPPLSPTSLPLPPSPPTPRFPSSLNTGETERGRDSGRERSGGKCVFSGIPSMWLHADSRPNGERGDCGLGRVSPTRGRGGDGGVHDHEPEQWHETGGVGGRESGIGIGNMGGSVGKNPGVNARQSLRPYEKLKTLTKRYSMNFPLSRFVDRSRPGTSSGAGMGWRRPTSHVSSPN